MNTLIGGSSSSDELTTSSLLKAMGVLTLFFAFTPGALCLFFYVFTDATKLTGVARWMSWWWVWMI